MTPGSARSALGRLIGADFHLVSRWEHGVGIRHHNLVRIGNATGKPLFWFYQDHDEGE
jgi:hypothetical protein